jgi:hypothetical protein
MWHQVTLSQSAQERPEEILTIAMPQSQCDGDGLRIATSRENANVVDERVQFIGDEELVDKKLDKFRRPA